MVAPLEEVEPFADRVGERLGIGIADLDDPEILRLRSTHRRDRLVEPPAQQRRDLGRVAAAPRPTRRSSFGWRPSASPTISKSESAPAIWMT